MTSEQKDYIEKNIELIEDGKWDEFFRTGCPLGTGGCLHAAAINFLSEISKIPSDAFHKSNISEIEIPDNITSIGDGAFSNCRRLMSVTIPDSVTWIYSGAFEWCTSLTRIEIPDSVESIDISAFQFCSSLNNVDIGNSVISIDDYAFADCGELTSIVLPNSIEEIRESAFANCYKLNKIMFKGTMEEWEDVEVKPSAFENCPCSKVICSDGIIYL